MKRTFLRHIFRALALAAALLAAPAARAAEYSFATLSIDEGLSQSSVNAMLRDSRGYIWIGTKSGLNRYGGERMENYYNDPSDESTIPGNDIHDIFEDSRGTVWVVAEGGVAVFDPLGRKFTRISCDGRPLHINSHALQPDGILMGGAGELYRYDYASRAVKPVATSGGSNRLYTSFEEWSDGRYLLGTRWDGLWVYNTASGRIDRLGITPERDIMACHVDSEGRLWVSAYGEGLKCYDRSGRILHHADAATLGNSIVLDMLCTGDTMWVSTDGGGLHTINIHSFETAPVGAGNQSLRSVIRLYEDPYGYVYAGTVRDGMTCITSSPMRTFTPGGSRRAMAVTSLLADGDKIWIGVDGDGIYLYEPDAGDRFTQQRATAGMKVTSLENYDSARLLLSTFDNGFHLFDKRSGALSPAPPMFAKIAEANAKKALSLDMRRLPGDKIAVMTDRIYVADLAKSTWEEAEATKVNSRLNEFYSDYRTILCHSEGEVISYEAGKGRVRTLAALPDRGITCAAYDGNRYIYLGTYSGIMQLDIETGDIRPMENKTPLPRHVTAMIIDNGRMWLAARGKVFLIDLNTGKTCRFDRYDGVDPNEFIYKSNLATPTRIYMGGVNGLLKIDRTEVGEYVDRKQCREPLLTDIKADGVALALLEPDGNYTLPYDHSAVSLRVDGGDTHPLRQSPFRFFINSPDGDNPIETADNTFTISRLAAGGRYDIYAQAVAPDGSWGSPRRVAIINVQRPWWRSPWAVAVYILLGLGFIATVMAYIIRRRKRMADKRMAVVRQETLEKEVGFLTQMNHELRTPLTLIYSRLKGMIDAMESSRIKDPSMLDELENIYQSTRRMRDIMNTTVDQWVKPEPGDGTAAETAAPTAEPETDTDPVDMSGMTVIIAEEDPDLRDYMAAHLQEMFGRVVTANGANALAEVKNNNPDLIITDALLSGKSGADLCRHIKRLSEYSHIPIVMLTTRVEDMSLRSGNDLGADIYITKPFDINQLAARCRMVVRTFHRVKQRYKGNAADILPRTTYNNESESFLLKIKEIIEENINQPGFGIDMIVEKMLMSRSSLYAKFKELTGQSLGAYVEDYRIGRAKEMLTTTDMTMSEISDALGFSTQRYFSTFFRKKTGMSPTEFRTQKHA